MNKPKRDTVQQFEVGHRVIVRDDNWARDECTPAGIELGGHYGHVVAVAPDGCPRVHIQGAIGGGIDPRMVAKPFISFLPQELDHAD